MIKSLEHLKDVIEENGYEDVIVFDNPSYYSAFIGISTDNRAVYDYNKMVEFLVKEEQMSYEEAAEFIDYNSSFSYGRDFPMVVNRLLEFE